MKIGIMTWWHNTNYGGFLQGIALQHFLAREGYDVELVSFATPRADLSVWHLLISPQSYDKLWQLPKRVLRVFRAIFVRAGLFARIIRLRKTARLFQEYAVSSPRLYNNLAQLDSDARYDTLVVGSDQVWTPLWHDKEFSYLLGGIGDRVRKLSYASSVAAPTIHPFEHIYGERLKRFVALSVREKSIIPELESIVDRKIEWVVDPTLLLSREEWISFLNLDLNSGERHITLYWLTDIETHLDEIISFAKRCACRVHLFSDVTNFNVRVNFGAWVRHLWARARVAGCRNLELKIGADAREFLQDIATSDFVVSDSFHAMMFATIFNKNAQIVITKSRQAMGSRIVDFVERVGSARLVDGLDAVAVEGFLDAPKRQDLTEWILNSKEFLNSNLQKCVSFGRGV